MDFLEAMLQWHVGNSTSADLVLRDVQDAIVSEVTSFPVDKVALGESPSVAMHVPVPTLRQNPNGGPCNSQELGAAAMRMDEKRSSGGASGASGSGPSSDDDSCDYASGEALVAGFPAWQGWTQPATALTLRAVLMTASALTAAAGMRQPVIGDPAKDARAGGGARLLKPQILFPEPTQELGDLREFFETLWPDAPYSFGTYGRDSVSSDDRYLKGDGVDGKKKLGRREKRLVIVVNVSSPGEESAAESDGEGMVNAAETLLELNVPFVVLTLWQDNSLVKSVQTKRARTEERDALRVLMERRTRILLGRSVRRKEARQKIRDAYARAVKMPQGKGYVALEEALAEAKAAGAEVGSEGDAMLAEIRSQARSAETDALAAALTSACLQVPVDVASLRANLQRARGVLEREEAEADEVATAAAAAAASESPASAPHVTAKPGALINMVYNDGVAASLDVGYSIDDDESGMVAPVGSVGSPIEEEEEEDDDDADPATPAAAGSLLGTMEDIDRFGAKKSDGGGDARGLAALRAAVAGAEAALEAVELEGDLRATLQDQGSLDVAAVPRLEALMLRAAKVAERKPPLTQEGAAKLNTLVSRCFSRATALQEMEGARASLAEALEPSLRGRDISPGSLEPGDVPRLEKAVARARTSAWPWQLEDAVAEAESTPSGGGRRGGGLGDEVEIRGATEGRRGDVRRDAPEPRSLQRRRAALGARRGARHGRRRSAPANVFRRFEGCVGRGSVDGRGGGDAQHHPAVAGHNGRRARAGDAGGVRGLANPRGGRRGSVEGGARRRDEEKARHRRGRRNELRRTPRGRREDRRAGSARQLLGVRRGRQAPDVRRQRGLQGHGRERSGRRVAVGGGCPG